MAIHIHHVNIRTNDVEGSVAFYTEALGLTKGYRPNF
ncbi:VOC family protein, partial [Roseiarcus sp.]